MSVLPVVFVPVVEALVTALTTVAVQKLIDDRHRSRF